MISLFFAREDINYTKCERLHLQKMFKIEMNKLWFMKGLHFVTLTQ